MYKDKNQIYQLTNEDRDTILEHKKFYDDFNKYGFFILDNCFDKEVIKDYELTIYSGIYKVLELLDTLNVMSENGLINSGYIIVRSLLEESVQLAYMIHNPDEIEKKATILQMLDIKRTCKDEKLFYLRMESIECYKNFIDNIKGKTFDNWYSFSEGSRTSLSKLFKIVGWDDVYTNLYQPLCKETHVITHMENNIVYGGNNTFYFKPFRHFENNLSLMKSILMTIVPLYSEFYDKYDTLKELKEEWNEYAKKSYEFIDNIKSINDCFGNPTKHFF